MKMKNKTKRNSFAAAYSTQNVIINYEVLPGYFLNPNTYRHYDTPFPRSILIFDFPVKKKNISDIAWKHVADYDFHSDISLCKKYVKSITLETHFKKYKF